MGRYLHRFFYLTPKLSFSPSPELTGCSYWAHYFVRYYTTEGKFLTVTHRITVRGNAAFRGSELLLCKHLWSHVRCRDGAQEDQALPLRGPFPLVTRASSPPGRGLDAYTVVIVRIECICIQCLKFRVKKAGLLHQLSFLRNGVKPGLYLHRFPPDPLVPRKASFYQ